MQTSAAVLLLLLHDFTLRGNAGRRRPEDSVTTALVTTRVGNSSEEEACSFGVDYSGFL